MNSTGALLGRGNPYSPDLFYLFSGVVPLEIKVMTRYCVDGFLQALCSNTRVASLSSLVALKEAQHVESELCPMIEGWFGKLEQCNTIIDKKFIHLDKE
jgi:hypothetical protein